MYLLIEFVLFIQVYLSWHHCTLEVWAVGDMCLECPQFPSLSLSSTFYKVQFACYLSSTNMIKYNRSKHSRSICQYTSGEMFHQVWSTFILWDFIISSFIWSWIFALFWFKLGSAYIIFPDMYLNYIIPFFLLSGSHVKAQVGQETYYEKDLDYEVFIIWTLWFCWLLALYSVFIPPSDPIKSEVTFSIMVIQPSEMVFLYYVVDYDELVTTFCSPGIVVETGLWSQIARWKSF